MSNIEENLAKSLTAKTTELIPFLPYLLQDLWELGSSPRDIKELIAKHIPVCEETKVLDLACGKGAVSIQLTRTFGCKVKGIDIFKEFIAYAKSKAEEYSVEKICEFIVEDINQSVRVERDYDIVILGAVGDVLGNSIETILKLKSTIKKRGYIIIDDAYSGEGSEERYPSKKQWHQVFQQTGVKLLLRRQLMILNWLKLIE
ncbi:hypothetical protein N752_29460 [Desulforamulus aquiferis]|nr:hypothetical protein N752_29460 [Desulforamulus aquiferis]